MKKEIFEIRSGVLEEYNGKGKEVSLPSSVRSVGHFAFSGCGVTKINFPYLISAIGDCAFKDCAKLAGIIIPAGITRIGQGTFDGCKKLKELKIPDGVVHIGAGAFKGCAGIKEMEIPYSVDFIAKEAFYGWKKNQTITLYKNRTGKWDPDWDIGCLASIIFLE